MRRLLRIVARALFCAAIAFATVVAGLVFHKHFSWARLRAEIDAFAAALGSGDASIVISALTSGPVITVALLLAVGAVLLIDWLVRGRGRHERDGD